MAEQNKRSGRSCGKFPVTEFTAAGTLIALFSVFLGFYSSAITFASQSYPELNPDLIELIHRKIFSNLVLFSATAVPMLAGLFYLLARRYSAMTGAGAASRD